jgi:multimeric flavodoxin WrbA
MKLLGLTCGRRMGNTEVLMKEAMMGAEESGAEVELIRMLDLEIGQCKQCKSCLWFTEGPGKCVIKDDGPFLYDKIMDADGFILGVPIYCWTAPGQVFVIRDRILGPRVDVAFAIEAKKSGTGMMGMGPAEPDERLFKPRVAGFIVNGGAHTTAQLALPPLHTLTFSMQAAVVDQLLVYDATAIPGAAVLMDNALKRANKLGRNVAAALGTQYDDVEYKGDDPGTCPMCHNNLMLVGNTNTIECSVCNILGKVRVEGDALSVTWPEEELKKGRLTIEGKRLHGTEIMEVMENLKPRFGEIPGKIAKYKEYDCIVKPPKKKK